jgi:hypothetical protein
MNERLVTGFSSHLSEFDSKPTHIVFVVDSLALTTRIFFCVFGFPLSLLCRMYVLFLQTTTIFCSFPFFPSFLNFSCWFRDLFRSCVATSEVTKLLLGLVILNFFSVRSRWACVHVLVFRSELCILFCCFLSKTQDLLLCVR